MTDNNLSVDAKFCEITGCRCRAFEASDNVARNAMVILLDSERLGLMKLARNELGEVVGVSITAAGRQYLAQVDRPKT